MNASPAAAPGGAPAIELAGLRKSFGAISALSGLSLTVPRGAVYGFLGPNGAGKTTTLKLLLGMSRPDDGRVRLFGRAIDSERASVAARRRIGFVGEAKELYPHMTVEQTIRFTRGFFPGWRGDLEAEFLHRFELPPGRRVTQLSKGMRAKLALVLACCRGADLLVLDEPTDGLDPASVERVLETLVRRVAADGTTVFFSSHQLHEVERIADHVGIVHRGRVVLEGELDGIRERFRRVRLVVAGDGDVPPELTADPAVLRTARSGRVLTLLVAGDAEAVVERARICAAPRSVETRPIGLRELFLEVTEAPS